MTGLIATGILGTGSALPEKRLTNSDLEKTVETSDEWILQRTGIRERRICDPSMPAAELAEHAARKAIEKSGVSVDELDMILVATLTPDSLTPSMSCSLQARIGAVNASAMDINAACTGFLYAMDTARQYIATGTAKYILLVAVECLSRVVDWEDRKTCVLFGDGAGAVVLGPVPEGMGILSSQIGASGHLGKALTLPGFYLSEEERVQRREGKTQVLWMDGSEVFAFASRTMASALQSAAEKAQIPIGDLDWIFPHQANMRILQNAQKRLRIPMERIYTNLEYTGNISSASIPVCLDEAAGKGLLKPGQTLGLVAFGGGLTFGAAVLRWTMA